MRNIFVVLLFSVFCVSNVLFAQQITVPYECGFEDPVEVGNWELNSGANGPQCQDQWMVGNLDNNGGFNSLYISCDTGKTTTYGAKPNVVIAYREVDVTTSDQVIVDCSFEWKCVGALGISELKFYMLPANFFSSVADLSSSHTSATLPRALRGMTPAATLSGSESWQYWSSSMDGKNYTLSPGEKWYMIFVWENKNKTVSEEKLYAACVDNVQLSFTDCWKPENLKVESMCDTIKISWEGYSDSFEFEYKKADARLWSGKTITKDKSIVLGGLGEGLYDIRVRGLCADMKSAWVIYNSAVCYCPDRHCINFVTLDGEGVICEVGDAIDLTTRQFNLTASLEGPIPGRHTAMWKQDELDPNTGNNLRTIPVGALASVRLGDKVGGGFAEGIKYEYIVDTMEAKIILMKYAVVLQKPGHGPKEDPGFILEILDQNGKKIDPSCVFFDFTPEKGDFWNKHGSYVWKDWTDIGLNLEAYHGQKIYIHLVTQDCTPKAHTGYAYFTLDCIDAAIKNNSCGETINIEMEAPDGFEYIWTNENDRDHVISREQKIEVPANDITTYFCEVRYKGLSNCGFELHTKVIPRFAHAQFDWEWKPENCENKVLFTNKSCVRTRINGVDTLTNEPCEAFEWRISNGEETSFENWECVFPKEGGTYDVILKSYISGGACSDDTIVTVVVPPIYEHYATIDTMVCEGDVILFNDTIRALPGEFTEYKKNCWGCDSITVLNLEVAPIPDDVHVYDTICSSGEYIFNGRNITETGDYKDKLLTVHGCDSVVWLHLKRELPMGISVPKEYRFACADASKLEIEFDFVDTLRSPEEYSLEFDNLAISAGFENQENIVIAESGNIVNIPIPNNCRPNNYSATIIFKDPSAICGDISVSVDFDVYYSSTILQSKFDNLITVLDETANGGYSFVEGEYIWFLNGDTIDGINTPYLYLGENVVFGPEDCYFLELKRVDDGVVMRTCPICPKMETDIDDIYELEEILPVTLFEKNQRIVIDNLDEGVVEVYTLTGQLLDTYKVGVDDKSIVAPNESGFYILRVVMSNYVMGYKIQVK